MKVVKGLPFLAMGGLTLGLVGATVLAPVVSAVDPATFNQKVTATVNAGLSVDINGAVAASDATNVTTALTPQAKDESKSVTVGAANNAGGFTLTMKGAAASADLVKANEAKTFKADGQIAAGGADSHWGVKFSKNAETIDSKAAYQGVPGNGGTALTLAESDNAAAEKTKIQYGFSTAADIPTGDYTTNVVFTAAEKPAANPGS